MISLTLLTRKKLNSQRVANCRHRENDDTHGRIEFEGQLSPFYFAVIMFYTCYCLFSCPAYTLSMFYQKEACETKVF